MSGSGFSQFIPLILIFVIFYILLIRPQQKKMKRHREMISNLKRGDKIITSGGIIGLITKVKETKEISLEISENVEIQIAPGMVTDLYISNENKKTPSDMKDPNSSNKGILAGIFNKKKN